MSHISERSVDGVIGKMNALSDILSVGAGLGLNQGFQKVSVRLQVPLKDLGLRAWALIRA